MTSGDRVQALEEEFQQEKDALRQILMEIRVYVMEATTPIPNDLERDQME